MILVLDYWARRWQSVAFDARSGDAHIRWFSRKPARCAGWATRHRNAWYGLWSDGAALIFQTGILRVPMAEPFRSTNTRSQSSRTFSIHDEEHRIVDIEYRAKDRDSDPSFDLSDLEQEDFFYFVSILWKDHRWQQQVIKNWAANPGADSR